MVMPEAVARDSTSRKATEKNGKVERRKQKGAKGIGAGLMSGGQDSSSLAFRVYAQ
jgi:hypothetical protein